MAIYELVKNAYDSDAMHVNVNFNNIDLLGIASISVEDDGTGMTSDIIENVWLEPESDFRKPVDPSTSSRRIIKSPIYHRVPMDEKGICRFAVHKLRTEITLITRPLLFTKDREGNVISTSLADYEIDLSKYFPDTSSTHSGKKRGTYSGTYYPCYRWLPAKIKRTFIQRWI